MSISYKNFKKTTPIKLEKLGSAILMFTSGMTLIISTLPIPSNTNIWINAGLSTIGLGAKIFTMMFADNETNIQINEQQS